MIYLDNAATTLQKPDCVREAVLAAFDRMGNAGRGASAPALDASRVIYGTREKLAGLFHAESPSRIVFTANATESLNIALKGLFVPGDHIITTVLEPIRELVDAAVKYNRVVLRSKLRTTAFVNELSIYLNELLAPTITIHGVLVDLYGVGVLLIGHSSVGKSESALELIQRGHRLVADDAVCLKRVNDRLVGSAPVKIRHLMEIRGLGIIDVEKMYGSGSVRQTKMVDFVACLEDWNEEKQYDRLGDETHTYNILDIDMPEYIIPVRPGRNVASILEAAARNFRAKLLGYNVMDELMYRAILERKH